MLFKKLKDQKHRNKFKKFENLNKIKNFLNNNLLCSDLIKSTTQRYIYKKSLKTLKYSKVSIVRRCILTNRNRSVIRPYNISRGILRELMQFSILPGYSKAVW